MTCPYRKITLDNGYNEIIEEFAECYIGIINDYENTTTVTLEELKSHIRDELELKHIYENDEMWKGYNHGIKGWTLADYCDKRKSTDLTRFNYCPMCGKEIDWKTMRDAMNNKCTCYRIQKERRYTYHPITGQPIEHDVEVGVCWGTRERDRCSCGGDRTKCDFYPEVREKAVSKMTDNEIIKALELHAYTLQYDEEQSLYAQALDLIKRQQARIELLTKERGGE